MARWRSMSGLNLSSPDSLMNEQRRSIAVRARELAGEVRQHALPVRVGDEPRGEERAARGRGGTHPRERPGGGDPAQQLLAKDRLARAQHAVLAKAGQDLPRDGHLLSGVGPGLDRYPRDVTDEGDELLVDVRVLLDLGDLEGVRPLEVGEPRLERLGDDLVVDPGRERSVRAAPDGHTASLRAPRTRPKRGRRCLPVLSGSMRTWVPGGAPTERGRGVIDGQSGLLAFRSWTVPRAAPAS